LTRPFHIFSERVWLVRPSWEWPRLWKKVINTKMLAGMFGFGGKGGGGGGGD
jgi:hypothetical protein